MNEKESIISLLLDKLEQNKTQWNLLPVSEKIRIMCDVTKEFLLKKNKAYGDSAVNPVRIFSKASPTEGIAIRLDDKISRLSCGKGLDFTDESTDDTIGDFAGYLPLMMIAMVDERLKK